MERGSGGGSDRAEWADPQPPADDDPPAGAAQPPPDAAACSEPDPGIANQDDAEMYRIQRDMAVANDWNPG